MVKCLPSICIDTGSSTCNNCSILAVGRLSEVILLMGRSFVSGAEVCMGNLSVFHLAFCIPKILSIKCIYKTSLHKQTKVFYERLVETD